MSKLSRYGKITLDTLSYFQECFSKSSQAQKYVFSRISKETVATFKLGYSPKSGLVQRLKDRLDDAVDLGILGKNEDGSYFEVFANRIMLPIIQAGVVIGFAGRTTIGHKTKYLNSRSSKFYNKKENLYGLWKTGKYMAELGHAFLVEGYFDVLGLWDKGVRNAAASCGTALADYHVLLFKRYAKGVYVCYDGDDAGRKASVRAKNLLERYSMFEGILSLPQGDPDDYIASNGKAAFLELAGLT